MVLEDREDADAKEEEHAQSEDQWHTVMADISTGGSKV